jgi:hypothetical protein
LQGSSDAGESETGSGRRVLSATSAAAKARDDLMTTHRLHFISMFPRIRYGLRDEQLIYSKYTSACRVEVGEILRGRLLWNRYPRKRQPSRPLSEPLLFWLRGWSGTEGNDEGISEKSKEARLAGDLPSIPGTGRKTGGTRSAHEFPLLFFPSGNRHRSSNTGKGERFFGCVFTRTVNPPIRNSFRKARVHVYPPGAGEMCPNGRWKLGAPV